MSGGWAAALDAATQHAASTGAGLRNWERMGVDEQAAEAVKLRRQLGRLGALIDALDEELSRDTTLSTRESDTRHAKVEALKADRSEMARKLREGATAPAPSAAVAARYSNISTPELHALHRVNVREQDESLDVLANSLVRQRQIGERIGDEATEQTHLLQAIGSHTDSAAGRVREETEHIEKLTVTGCNISLYVTIGILVVLVIVLLATDGGCYVIRSRASCAADHTGAPATTPPATVNATVRLAASAPSPLSMTLSMTLCAAALMGALM